MRKYLVLFLAVLVAALGISVGAATAGNGATVTQFTAAYCNETGSTDPTQPCTDFGGWFTCAGVRIVKTAPKGFIKDSETCTMSLPASFGPPGTRTIEPGDWCSDYEGFVLNTGCNEAVSGTLEVKANGTVTITAYYNTP